MALCIIRSAAYKTLRWNLRESFKVSKQVAVRFHNFHLKPSRASNLMIQQRSHYWVSGILGKQTEITLKNLDKVPNGLKMIYRHDDLDLHFKWLYLAVFVMAGILVTLVVFKIDKQGPKFHLEEEAFTMRYEYVMALFIFSLCFMAFHGCMKRMPVRIYKVPKTDNYIIIVYSSIPFTTRKIPCRRGQCVKVDPSSYPSFIPCYDLYRIADEQNVYMFEDAFKRPADLHVMLGIQEDYDDE